MSKTLYEEALADAKKLKEVAENNAKRAVEEAVLPKIRDLIEKKLFEDLELEANEEDKENMLLDLVSDSKEEEKEDHEEKNESEDESLEEQAFNMESLMNIADLSKDKFLKENLDSIKEDVRLFKSASKIIKETNEYSLHLDNLLENIKNVYIYTQKNISDDLLKEEIKDRLENYFKDTKSLKETKMKGVYDLMSEADLTIKLTGVPEELDVEDLGIDLITGEDDEEVEASLDADSDEDSSDETDAEESSDEKDVELDLGSEDSSSEAEEKDDEEVVEISESMLKREILRMRSARMSEAAKSMKLSTSFDEWEEEGDPIVDIDLSESDKMEDKMDDEMDEDAHQTQKGTSPAEQPNDQRESDVSALDDDDLEEMIKNETDVYHECLKRYHYYKNSLNESRKAKNWKKESACKSGAMKEAEKAKKSKKRMSALKKMKEARRSKLRTEGVVTRRPATVAEDRSQVESLRKKLNETNLFNAKLYATNKLLQNESLTAKQKTAAIERLDDAKTVREVKLVYESIAKALTGRRTVTESTNRLIGSSSRATSPGATLTESFEANRWARLAGIK